MKLYCKWVYIDTCLARVNFLIFRFIRNSLNGTGQKRGRRASWHKDIGGSPTNTLQNQTETTCQGLDKLFFLQGFPSLGQWTCLWKQITWLSKPIAWCSELPNPPRRPRNWSDPWWPEMHQQTMQIHENQLSMSMGSWNLMDSWEFLPNLSIPAKPLTPEAPDREVAITPRLQVIMETDDFGRNALTFRIGLKKSGPEVGTNTTHQKHKARKHQS